MSDRIPLQKIVRIVGILLTVLVTTAILVFSLMPKESYPNIQWIPFADKGDHMLAYAAFGFSFFLAILQIPGSGNIRRRANVKPHSTLHLTSWSGRSVIITLIVGTMLGALVEFMQPYFGRSREWMDLAADFMGLVVGLAIAQVLLKLVAGYFSTRPWLYDPNWKDEVNDAVK